VPTPWDIYVDECKVPGDFCLGFLEVPNTASFMHKLFRCRQSVIRGRTITQEIHWSELRRDTALLARRWIEVVFQHRGAKFHLRSWSRHNTKEVEIVQFISDFCRRKKLASPPHDVVVFLDYDSGHARERTQNTIRETAQIARCYHLDSVKNDCIQCCDLLLGAVRALPGQSLTEMPPDWPNGLPNSRIKADLSGFLQAKIDQNSSCVYDQRVGADRTHRR